MHLPVATWTMFRSLNHRNEKNVVQILPPHKRKKSDIEPALGLSQGLDLLWPRWNLGFVTGLGNGPRYYNSMLRRLSRKWRAARALGFRGRWSINSWPLLCCQTLQYVAGQDLFCLSYAPCLDTSVHEFPRVQEILWHGNKKLNLRFRQKLRLKEHLKASKNHSKMLVICCWSTWTQTRPSPLFSPGQAVNFWRSSFKPQHLTPGPSGDRRIVDVFFPTVWRFGVV